MKFGIVLLSTGDKYKYFINPLIESAFKYFPKPFEIFLLTDEQDSFNAITIKYPNLGWPGASLYRYHAIVNNQSFFRNTKITHLFWMDIDMLFVNFIQPEELLSDGIVSVIHPGFPDAFCRDPKSTAYVSPCSRTYYTGCFQGGELNRVIRMSEIIANRINIDDDNNVMAIWHDESHYNRYLVDSPPDKILTPAYAYPEEHYIRNKESWWTPQSVVKIRHLEKKDQHLWK